MRMSNVIPHRGVLRVANNTQLAASEKAARERSAIEKQERVADSMTGLVQYIRSQFEMMRSHRANPSAGWDERMLASLRAFNGVYDAAKLQQIKQFGGSEIYARLTAMKCRGASSLLRDVYLSNERSWGLEPTPDPEVPAEITQSILRLVEVETQTLQANGQPIDANMIRDRVFGMMAAAREAAKKRSKARTKIAQDKMDEILNEGGFYNAMSEFLQDIPLFPFGCLKGPTVRIVPTVTWKNGEPIMENKPRLHWQRVSPFDLFWTPGVSRIEDASIIEKTRLTRADLNDLLDLPGYEHDAIRTILTQFGSGGVFDNWDQTESERAELERRESPQMNRSGMISCLEFHGNVQGTYLKDYGLKGIDDPLRDYMVTAWLIDRHVIKVQLSPSPRKRHPYYVTSFEKMPGTPVGNGLPDILSDIQEMANGSLRALANNLSISSGPQVVVNDERLSPGESGDELYPWKRWHVTSDPVANATQKPIEFFQPQSYAQELLGIYKEMMAIADDLSAIPKYLAGGAAGSGAGRTASGLAMLMGNASKMLQTVCANIDRDCLEPAMTNLYDLLMLTDRSGFLDGNEQIRILGVQVAIQRETQRSRQIEFLGVTANPIDAQIMGPHGRATILRSVADTLGLPGANIVPSEEQLMAQQKQAQDMAKAQGVPGHAGVGDKAAAAQGDKPPNGGQATGDMGPRTSIAGGAG